MHQAFLIRDWAIVISRIRKDTLMLFALMMAREGSCVKILTLLRRKSLLSFQWTSGFCPLAAIRGLLRGFWLALASDWNRLHRATWFRGGATGPVHYRGGLWKNELWGRTMRVERRTNTNKKKSQLLRYLDCWALTRYCRWCHHQ